MALQEQRDSAAHLIASYETNLIARSGRGGEILTLARGLVEVIDLLNEHEARINDLILRVENLERSPHLDMRVDPPPSRSPQDYDPGSADTPVGELPGATLADLLDAACRLLVDVISEDASDEAEAWVRVFNEAARRLRSEEVETRTTTWLEGHAAGMEQGRVDGERAAMARIVDAINAAQAEPQS